jgi:hypothetical protein
MTGILQISELLDGWIWDFGMRFAARRRMLRRYILDFFRYMGLGSVYSY